MRDSCGIQSFDSLEAGKIPGVERQDSLHFVDAHDRNEMGVMHLDSGDAIIHEQSAPLFVYCEAIGGNRSRDSNRRARRSVSAGDKPKPLRSTGRVEAFQNSPRF